ncbi:Heat shock cognate 70 kDa protein 2 [Acorus gramineus]|uniref:Heat shock cognate 70 kDa protein 2 n=1 Tax=Acorus gramineus TaxID=55184 RepID=A0AAV9BDJ4_ACOGR|nr:Heat shock cognate 70 kDa protein 2 [Acorus gramineus]
MKLWPFKVIPDPSDKPMIVISFKNEQKHFAPKEISATVLIKMKEIAQAYLGFSSLSHFGLIFLQLLMEELLNGSLSVFF